MQYKFTLKLGDTQIEEIIEVPEDELIHYKYDLERLGVIDDKLTMWVWNNIEPSYEPVEN